MYVYIILFLQNRANDTGSMSTTTTSTKTVPTTKTHSRDTTSPILVIDHDDKSKTTKLGQRSIEETKSTAIPDYNPPQRLIYLCIS